MCDVDETTSLFFDNHNLPRSYGTTSTLFVKPDFKMIKHKITSADTLQGLSLKYGISVMEIKRINKIWSNDNIHTYDSLNIPVHGSFSSNDINTNGYHSENDTNSSSKLSKSESSVSAAELLKRVDATLNHPKMQNLDGDSKIISQYVGAQVQQ